MRKKLFGLITIAILLATVGIASASVIDNSQPLSIATYVWLETNNTINPIFSSFINSTVSGIDLGVTSSGKINFSLGNGVSVYSAISTQTLSTGQWYHVVATWNKSKSLIYINGVQVSYDNQDDTSSYASGGDDFLGKNNNSNYLNGSLDDFRIYNVSLTAQQVSDLAGIMYQGSVDNPNMSALEYQQNWTADLGSSKQEFYYTVYAEDNSSQTGTFAPAWYNFTYDIPAPIITFNYQTPTDINSSLLTNVNFSYNVSSGVALNDSTKIFQYKINTTSSNCISYLNGSANCGWMTTTYFSNNDSTTYNYGVNYYNILPGSYNLNQSLFDDDTPSATYIQLNSSSQGVKFRLYNVSNSNRYGWLSLMVNNSGTDSPLTIKICNSTSSCADLYTMTSANTYDYCMNNSCFHNIPFTINETNGSIKGIGITPNYMDFQIIGSDSYSMNIYGINQETRPDTTKLDTGSGYSNYGGFTVNAHLVQMNSNTYIYTNFSINNTNAFEGSLNRTEQIEPVGVSPTAGIITSPISQSYAKPGTLDINYTNWVSPQGYVISNYTLDLLNNDSSFNSFIYNNQQNISYTWNYSAKTGGQYKIRVTGCDTLNQCSIAISSAFYLNSPPSLNFVEIRNADSSLNNNSNKSQKNATITFYVAGKDGDSNTVSLKMCSNLPLSWNNCSVICQTNNVGFNPSSYTNISCTYIASLNQTLNTAYAMIQDFADTTISGANNYYVNQPITFSSYNVTDNLTYGKMATIKITLSDTEDATFSNANITMTDPDGVVKISNVAMTSLNSTSFQYVYMVDAIGTWNISFRARDNDNGLSYSSTYQMVVASGNISLPGRIYGWDFASLPTYATINSTINQYKYYSVELRINRTTTWSTVSTILGQMKNNSQLAMLTFEDDLSNINASVTYIQTNYPDLIDGEHLNSIRLLKVRPTTNVSNPSNDAAINNISKQIFQSTSNKFGAYLRDYPTISGINANYITNDTVDYVNISSTSSFITNEMLLLRMQERTESDELSRIYDGVTNQTLALYWQNVILSKLRSDINHSVNYSNPLIAELENRDFIVGNPNATTSTYDFDLNPYDVGYDAYDLTNQKIISKNITGHITFTLPAQTGAVVYITNLTKIQIGQDDTKTIYGAGVSAGLSTENLSTANWGNAMQFVSGPSNPEDARVLFLDPTYKEADFYIWYGTHGYEAIKDWSKYAHVVLGDMTSASWVNNISNLTEVYGYNSVNNYGNNNYPLGCTPGVDCTTWNRTYWLQGKESTMDVWYNMNTGKVNMFIDGLDIGSVNDVDGLFGDSLVTLTNYVKINLGVKALLNTYTSYENYANLGDATMRESACGRWNGTVSNPVYTYEDINLEIQRAAYHKSHGVPVWAETFGNITDYQKAYYCYMQTKVLYGDLSIYSYNQPTFDYTGAPDSYQWDIYKYPDLGEQLEDDYSKIGTDVYQRRYENGIVKVNVTTHTASYQSDRQIYNMQVCGNYYDNDDTHEGMMHFVINRNLSHAFNVSDSDLTAFAKTWKCVNISSSNFEPSGYYEMQFYYLNETGNYVGNNGLYIYHDYNPLTDRWSFYDTVLDDHPVNNQANYQYYPTGDNWQMAFSINSTRQGVPLDTISTITRTTSGGGVKTINISSSYDWNIPIYDKIENMSVNAFRGILVNTTYLNVVNNSDCITDTPTLNSTVINGDTWQACIYKPNGNGYSVRVVVPHLSNQSYEIYGNLPPTINSENYSLNNLLNGNQNWTFYINITDPDNDTMSACGVIYNNADINGTYVNSTSICTLNFSTTLNATIPTVIPFAYDIYGERVNGSSRSLLNYSYNNLTSDYDRTSTITQQYVYQTYNITNGQSQAYSNINWSRNSTDSISLININSSSVSRFSREFPINVVNAGSYDYKRRSDNTYFVDNENEAVFKDVNISWLQYATYGTLPSIYLEFNASLYPYFRTGNQVVTLVGVGNVPVINGDVNGTTMKWYTASTNGNLQYNVTHGAILLSSQNLTTAVSDSNYIRYHSRNFTINVSIPLDASSNISFTINKTYLNNWTEKLSYTSLIYDNNSNSVSNIIIENSTAINVSFLTTANKSYFTHNLSWYYIVDNYPVIQSARLSPQNPNMGDMVQAFCNATDSDVSDSIRYYYILYVNNTENRTGVSSVYANGIETNIVNFTGLSKKDELKLNCLPNDQYYNGTSSLNSSIISYGNVAPISFATVSPIPVYSNDTLNFYCNTTDSDDYNITIRYRIYENGTQYGTESSVAKTNASNQDYVLVFNLAMSSDIQKGKGNNWSVSCMGVDSFAQGNWSSNYSTVVQNTAPDMNSVSIFPSQSFIGDTIYGYCQATDIDADNVMYYYHWYKDGVLNISGVSSNYTSGSPTPVSNLTGITKRYENWTFDCLASDSFLNDSVYHNASINISNSLSVVQTSRILPQIVHANDTLRGYCNATDADGTDVKYHYAWYRNSVLNVSGETPYYPSGLEIDINEHSNLLSSDSWLFGCMAEDDVGVGSWINSTPISVINTPPNLTLRIVPPNPYNNIDTLQGYCTPVDVDVGDKMIVYYEMFINGVSNFSGYYNDQTPNVEIAVGNNISNLVYGYNYTLSCEVSDGSQVASWTNTSVLISDYPPSMQTPTIRGNTVNESLSQIIGNCSASDVDTANVTYSWKFYRNQTLYSSGTLDNYTQGINVNLANVSTNIFRGDIWVLSCQATDLLKTSDWMNSTNFIIPNRMPIILDVKILPENANKTVDLQGYCNSSDADLNQVKYHWIWYKNGVENTTGVSSYYAQSTMVNVVNVSSSNILKGENWTFSCKAQDDILNSSWLNSSVRMIQNTIPVANLRINPTTAYNNYGDIEGYCTPSDVDIADMSNLSVQYNWTRNNTLNITGTYNVQYSGVEIKLGVNISNLSYADTWTLGCRVYDGYNYTQWNSTNITIDDRTPNILNAIITYDDVKRNITGYCKGADNDTSNIRYNWKLDLDGGTYLTGTSSAYPNNTMEIVVENLNDIQADQKWSIGCQVTDSFKNSSWLYSNNITIINTPPNIIDVRVYPNISVTTNLDMVGKCTGYDIDNQPLLYSWIWYNNGSVISSGTMGQRYASGVEKDLYTISHTLTTKGDNWTFSCQAQDGVNYSSWKNTSMVNIINSVPTISSVSISPSIAYNTTEINGTCAASDLDLENLDYEWQWKLNGTLYENGSVLNVSSGSILISLSAKSEGTNATFSCRVNDSFAYSGWTDSSQKTFRSLPPVVNQSMIFSNNSNPSVAYYGNTLFGNCTATDDDIQNVNITYSWYLNDILQVSNSTLAVPGVETQLYTNRSGLVSGQNWKLVCTASDRYSTSNSNTSDNFRISNTPPITTLTTLTPSIAYKGETLVGHCVGTDVDGNVKYHWILYKNNIVYNSGQTGFAPSDTVVDVTGIISPSNVVRADKYNFSCQADDGTDKSFWINSSTLTISNTLPVIKPAIVTPQHPEIGSSITGYCNSSDVDGDTIRYNYEWYLNGTLNHGGFTTDNAEGSAVEIETIYGLNYTDRWKLNCTAFDGTGYSSTSGFSNEVIVGNTPPTTQTSSITPLSATATDTLYGKCKVSDLDTPTLSIDYIWYRNNVVLASGTTTGITENVETTINSINTGYYGGDYINFSCRGYDGQYYSDWMNSTEQYIDYSPFTFSSVSINPSSPKSSQNMYGQCRVNNPDNRNVTFTWIWYDNDDVELKRASGNNFTNILLALSSYKTIKGNQVIFSCYADYGTGNTGWYNSTPITVVNTEPTSTAIVTPAGAGRGQSIDLKCQAHDYDSDATTMYWETYFNNTLVTSGYDTTPFSAEEIRVENNIPSSTVGTYKIKCKAKDTEEGVWTESSYSVNDNIPTATARISPTNPNVGDTITGYCNGADADSDNLRYDYQWYLNDVAYGSEGHTGEYAPGEISIGTQTDILANQKWQLKCLPRDPFASGSYGSLYTIFTPIVNAPPVVTSVTLTPSSAYASTTLVGQCTATDSDDATINYNWYWKMGGVTQTTGTQSAPQGSTITQSYAGTKAYNQIWTFTCTASDLSHTSAEVGSSPITILNSNPTSTAGITPSNPMRLQQINGTCSGTDPDGQQINYLYQWQKGGFYVYNDENPTLFNSGTTAQINTFSQSVVKGDTLQFFCRAKDSIGGIQPSYTFSSAITIINTPPVASNVRINPNGTTDSTTLQGYCTGSDDDTSDTLTYSWQWYKNNVLNSSLSGSSIQTSGEHLLSTINASDGVEQNSNWVFKCRISDGTDYSNSGIYNASDSTYIRSLYPTMDIASIIPLNPTASSTITAYCQASGYAESTMKYYYTWKKNGIVFANGVSPAGNTQGVNVSVAARTSLIKGDTWQINCTAENNLGYKSSTLNSNVVTVMNTVPTNPTVTITNNPIYTSSSVQANCSSTDLDADSMTYYGEWYINDSVLYESQTATSQTGIHLFTFSKNISWGETVKFRCRAGDGEGYSGYSTTSTKTVLNSPIQIGSSVSPAKPLPTNVLSGSCIINDNDLDLQNYSLEYSWYKNDSFINKTTVSISYLDFGVSKVYDQAEINAFENWSFICNVTDGFNEGAYFSINMSNTTVSTQNYPPEIVSSSINGAENIYWNTAMPGNCTISDRDDIMTNVSYIWYKNGDVAYSGDALNVPTSTLGINNLINTYSGAKVKGDNFTFSCKASDTQDANSSWINSSQKTVVNFVPTISASLVPSGTVYEQSNVAGYCNGYDDDVNDLTFYWNLTRNGTLNTSGSTTLTQGSHNIVNFIAYATDRWELNCTAGDSESTGISNIFYQNISNRIPVADGRLTPEHPYVFNTTTGNLTIVQAICNVSDDDLYQTNFTFNYSIYRNDVLNMTGITYGAKNVNINVANITNVSSGDIWNFTCQVSDRYDLSNVVKTSVYFNNSIMNATARISPISPEIYNSTGQPTVLLGYCNATDDYLFARNYTFYYKWYKNNVLNSSGTYNGTKGVELNIANTTGLGANDLWNFTCYVNDSYNVSNTSNYNVSVFSLAPVSTLSLIHPSTAYKNDTLRGYCNATDLDTTALSYYYTWYRNGVLNKSGSVSGYNATLKEIANVSSLMKNENWTLECRAKDDVRFGNYINSTITIMNTLPTASGNLSISLDKKLSFQTFNNVDIDGDSISRSTLYWYIDSIFMPSYTDETTIDLTNSSNGTRVRTEFKLNDGSGTTDWLISNVVYLGDNEAPVMSDITLNPTSSNQTSSQFTLTMKCVDNSGQINTAWGYPKVLIYQPNDGNFKNVTLGATVVPDVYTATVTAQHEGPTNYTFDFQCADGNGNLAENKSASNNLLYYIQSLSPIIIVNPTYASGGNPEVVVIKEGLNITRFKVTPITATTSVAPGGTKLIEFSVENTYVNDENIKLSIVNNEVYDWMYFESGNSIFKSISLDVPKDPLKNTQFVRFYIKVPADANLGTYNGLINITTGNEATMYNIKITVEKGFFSNILEFLSSKVFEFQTGALAVTSTGTNTGSTVAVYYWQLILGALILIGGTLWILRIRSK